MLTLTRSHAHSLTAFHSGVQLISILLKKFCVTDHPNKFALFEEYKGDSEYGVEGGRGPRGWEEQRGWEGMKGCGRGPRGWEGAKGLGGSEVV